MKSYWVQAHHASTWLNPNSSLNLISYWIRFNQVNCLSPNQTHLGLGGITLGTSIGLDQAKQLAHFLFFSLDLAQILWKGCMMRSRGTHALACSRCAHQWNPCGGIRGAHAPLWFQHEEKGKRAHAPSLSCLDKDKQLPSVGAHFTYLFGRDHIPFRSNFLKKKSD